jgi:hypothetical protein
MCFRSCHRPPDFLLVASAFNAEFSVIQSWSMCNGFRGLLKSGCLSILDGKTNNMRLFDGHVLGEERPNASGTLGSSSHILKFFGLPDSGDPC